MSPSMPLPTPAISPDISPVPFRQSPLVQHGAGWIALHETINAALPPGAWLASAGEERGALRAYVAGRRDATDDVDATLAWARDQSMCTCETCGSRDGSLRGWTGHWFRTVCDACDDAQRGSRWF